MPTGEPNSEESFAARLSAVEERIASALAASGRSRSEITLVAVSKKFSADKIVEAYRCGCRDFGENYVQEFAEKKPALSGLEGARFHLIGHLQSNKSRQACGLFHVVETVDSVKLLQRLDAAAEEEGKLLELMIEVKLGDEESKSGCGPEGIGGLVTAAKDCSHVSLTGLMTIPPWSEDPEISRPYFRSLKALADQHRLPKISMGMSNDLEVAIAEGATHIRIGTALFGARPKPNAGT